MALSDGYVEYNPAAVHRQEQTGLFPQGEPSSSATLQVLAERLRVDRRFEN
jgi:hypothetical protein